MQAAPELAEFGERRMAAAPAYLATIMGQGLPRVHPVSPHVRDGHVCVYMYPTSPKAEDIRGDGRYALHTSVADHNGADGEFHIRGHATPVDDPITVGSLARDGYVLFELLIDEALAVRYPDDGPPNRQAWRRPA